MINDYISDNSIQKLLYEYIIVYEYILLSNLICIYIYIYTYILNKLYPSQYFNGINVVSTLWINVQITFIRR